LFGVTSFEGQARQDLPTTDKDPQTQRVPIKKELESFGAIDDLAW
jgi:hypothetical protein